MARKSWFIRAIVVGLVVEALLVIGLIASSSAPSTVSVPTLASLPTSVANADEPGAASSPLARDPARGADYSTPPLAPSSEPIVPVSQLVARPGMDAAPIVEVPSPVAPSPAEPPTAPTAVPTLPPFPSPIPLSQAQPVEIPQEPLPNQIIITFAPDASRQAREAYIAQLGGEVTQSIDALNTVVVELPTNFASEPLPQSAFVTQSEPDYMVTAQIDVPPSDPLYPQQWALPAIGAPDAWLELPADAPQVTVAVIDSGICADHPDLQGRILPGWDFVEDDAEPQDAFGHGCGVAGIIAANVDDGIGMAGVAPNAMVLPLRVLDASGIGSYSDVAAAIVRATDDGAQVINLSLGGAFPSTVLENAINYAIDAGVTVVAAAGNTGSEQVLYPAAYEPVIAVGAVDEQLEPASFSARGAGVDIWAPGQNVLTTQIDGTYTSANGTSFAAPYAAGVIGALAYSDGESILVDPILGTGDLLPVTKETLEGPIGALGIFLPDNRFRIENTDQFPWSAIVHIQLGTTINILGLPFQLPNHCTGSLIAPDYVLTAAHCLIYIDSETGTEVYSNVLWVTAGDNGNSEPFGRRSVSTVIVPSEWTGRWDPQYFQYDYAVLKLDSGFPSEAGQFDLGYFSDAYLTELSNSNIAGYPGDKCRILSSVIQCDNPVDQQLYPHDTLWLDNGPLLAIQPSALYYQIDTYSGTSGSGLWIIDNTYRIIGINHAGCVTPEESNCDSTDANIAVRITPQIVQVLRGRNIPFHFVTDCLPLTLSTQGNGSVETSTSSSTGCGIQEFVSGTAVTLTANPDLGWHFSHWLGGPTGGAETSYTVAGPATITAVFEPDNPTPTPPPIPQTELDALVALYNSTGGSSWTRNDGWLSGASPCTWYGIGCIDDHVTIIDLTGNQLTGSIPPALGNLAALERLELDSNQLSGTIPAELGNQAALRVLRLNDNQLSGIIPSSLGDLAVLGRLELGNNQLSGTIPAELGGLTELLVLALAANQLEGSIPPSLGNLTNLQELYLSSNELSGSIPPELGSLLNLRALVLSASPTANHLLSGSIPSSLGNLTNLQTLSLGLNQLTGPIPPELGNLVNLRYLRLEGNRLSGIIPAELGNLAELRYLDLEANLLSGHIPPELGNLSNLERLFLYFNQLTGEIPSSLGNLTNLQYLYLSANQLSGSIPPELENLSSLSSLQLSGNQLSGTIPAELGNLTNLNSLTLDGNQLSGAIPTDLANLVNLDFLYLDGNRLSGAIPPVLGNMVSLRYLKLSRNQLSEDIPLTITNLINLTNLDVSKNMLTASDPAVLAFMDSGSPDWDLSQTIAPSNVQIADVTSSTAALTWNMIPYTADGGYYEVMVSNNSDGPFDLSGCMTPDKTIGGCTVYGLSPNTTYYFAVRTFTPAHDLQGFEAQQNDLTSNLSSVVSTTTSSGLNLPLLASPEGGAVFDRNTDVLLTWHPWAIGAEYYAEFWGGPSVNINSGWIINLDWFVGSTLWGGDYQWRVKARNSGGESDWSETRTLTIRYGAPTNLAANAVSPSQIDLVWNASADAPGNIDGYRINRDGVVIGTAQSSATTFSDSNLACNTSHSYEVRAYKGGSESIDSNTASATTQACGSDTTPPTGSIISPMNGLAINWSTVDIAANAADDSSGVNRVEFWANYETGGVKDWRLLGTVSTFPYVHTWDWSQLADQSIDFRIDVYDNAGNATSAVGGIVTAQLDRTAPTAAFSFPLENAYLNVNAVMLELAASDVFTGVSNVQFFAGYNDAVGAGLSSQSAPTLAPPAPDAVGAAQDVVAQDYWHDLGWDSDGSDGWELLWDASTVSDQAGVAFYSYACDQAGNCQGVGVYNITLDRTPPVITLLGDNPLELALGTPYAEPGFTALDNLGGDISASVVVTGTVDTNTVDSYTLTYNASDMAGNDATPVTRTVNVNGTACTPSSTEVALFDGTNYTGTCVVLGPGEYPNAAAMNFADNTLSSILVGDLVQAHLCQNENMDFGSPCEGSYGDPDLSDNPVGDNQVSSLRVNARNLGDWTAVYYSGHNLWTNYPDNTNQQCGSIVGGPMFSFDYGAGAPCNGMDADNWTGVFYTWVDLPAGDYAFRIINNDGIRLLVDLQPLVETEVAGTSWLCPPTPLSGVTGFIAILREDIGNAAIGISWTTDPVCQTAPANLAATPASQTEISLTWDDTSSAETGFRVERSPDGQTGWTVVTTVGAGVTSYLDNGLTCGMTYWYRVRANGSEAGMESPWSNSASATTTSCDTTPPVITLLGDNPLNLTVGDTFTEPSYTATDDVDGDITTNVVVTGTVDTNTVGSYTLTYNVSDAAGNAATPVTRTINVNAPATATLDATFTIAGGHATYVLPLEVTLVDPTTSAIVLQQNLTSTGDASSGHFGLSGIIPGTYDLYVKGSNTLREMRPITVSAGTNSVSFGNLRSGDANNDNIVSLADFSVLALSFNKSDGMPGYDARADFNGDHVISLSDFSKLALNFNTVGAQLPPP